MPPWVDYGPMHSSYFCYSTEYGNECSTVRSPPAGAPTWYAGVGYYGPETCDYGSADEYGQRPWICAAPYFGTSPTVQIIEKWWIPGLSELGYGWLQPNSFYGWGGNPAGGFPGNADSNMAAVQKILAPFGDKAFELATVAAWQLMTGRGIEPYWTPAESNAATIVKHAVTAALTSPQFSGDVRAQALLAYFSSAAWTAFEVQAAQAAYQLGVSHAAANESDSALQGFMKAFSGFMVVAGPLMLVTGGFAAILAAIQNGAAAGAAVGLPELTTLDALKFGYQVADMATPHEANFGLPISPLTVLSASNTVSGALTSLTEIAITGEVPPIYEFIEATGGGEALAPVVESTTEVTAMPLSQFEDYSYEAPIVDDWSYMGMDTGNLGLDVPVYDEFSGMDALADTPMVDEFGGTGSVEYTPMAEGAPAGDLTGAVEGGDFGTAMAVGDFQAGGSSYVDQAGTAWYYDAEGNVIGAMNADGSYYLPDSGGNLQYAGAMGAAEAAAVASSGFSLDSITKLAMTGLSIYSAIQKLTMDRELAERGIRPGTTAAGQTRTVRDPRTGQLVTQRLDTRTGQWVTSGPSPGAAPAGAGLTQSIGGVPMWVWLAGGGLAIFALAGRDNRARR